MSSKIIRLTAENVKRINAVEITPDGNLVVIAGKNGQGKTSVLDSIMYALAGAGSLPQKPVRRGEDKAVIELDLGDLLVKRTFTATGGTSLTVTTKDGVRLTSPQSVLDALVGKLSFDPLAFAQQEAKQRSETLRVLLGLDFTEKDAERQKHYDDRTAVNRELKNMEARLAALPPMQDGVSEEQSTAAILEEQKSASDVNFKNRDTRGNAANLRRDANSAQARVTAQANVVKDTGIQIKRLQALLVSQEQSLAQLETELAKADGAAKALEESASKLQDADLTPFKQRLLDVEKANHQVRQNKMRNELSAQVRDKAKASEALTKKIDAVEKAKRDSISSAKFPVDGLSMSEIGDVLFNGLPFEQASTAEQLRVSVAIGLALNSKLRVLLVRRGSDLDEDSLKMVADMAANADAQVWLEKVSEDGAVSVIIEDGYARVPIQEQEAVAK